MFQKKEGFTLIELLAVIVILAVIALIATPLIMNVINDARKNSFKDSVYGITKAVELRVMEQDIEELAGTYKVNITGENSDINYSGERPTMGIAVIDENGRIKVYMCNDSYCATNTDESDNRIEEVRIETESSKQEAIKTKITQIIEDDTIPHIGDEQPVKPSGITLSSLTENAQDSSTLNYGTNNGSGVYKVTENGVDYYFYRGNKSDVNNNVILGNTCFLMVTTTKTGGMKMIYNGLATEQDGKKVCIEEDAVVAKMAFNNSTSNEKYVGYVYDGETPSSIKNEVDNWYNGTTLSENDKTHLENIDFCIDKSTTDAANPIYYGPYTRLYTSKTPKMTCPDGQQILSEKVGLLSADEASFAGLVYYSPANPSNYLITESDYWLLSPFYYKGDAYAWHVYSIGSLFYRVVNAWYYVRPVVSLKPGTTFVEGGEGTSINPYVVK